MHNNVVMQRRARKERASDLARSFIANMSTNEEFHRAEQKKNIFIATKIEGVFFLEFLIEKISSLHF